MTIRELFHNIITANSDYVDFQSYRRMVLINAILYATAFIFIFFSMLNLFNGIAIIALLDIIAGLISIYAIYDLRKNRILKRATNIATFNLAIFFLLFVLTNHSDNFGLIWTIFFPLFTILAHGHKRGILIVFGFYMIIFPLTYSGIGIWDGGVAWNLQSFLRLFFASVLLSYVIYFYELSQEKSEKALEEIRKSEKEILEKLRLSSYSDSLTTLYNRRYFNELVPKLLSLSQRTDSFFTFFILDIDFFKEYNDFYGHQEGDIALRDVASSLKHTIQRNDDFVFRLGGEEFGGIVVSKDITNIDLLMQKTINNLKKLEIEHTKSSVNSYLSASLGYVSLRVREDTTIEDIYKRADKALYKAKESGRDQVVKAN